MKIQVTQDDINVGHRCSVAACPLAIAICRAVGHNELIVVSCAVSIRGKLYMLPESAREFIDMYDTSKFGHQPIPFEFELEGL